MTRQQIAEVMDCHINYIHSTFEAAIKENPELDIYDPSNNQKGKGCDYTLEQVLLAMSYYREGHGISEIEKAILTDEFTMRPPEKVKAIGIKGTDEFLKKIKNYPKKKCCSTCVYCTKSTMRNRKPIPKPFCKLWDRFLNRIKVDPYNDWCNQWEYSNQEPLIFYEHNSPVNLDIYGNIKNEVMGFDVSEFSKKSDGKIKLVTDIGFSEPLPV